MEVDWGYTQTNGPDTWQKYYQDCTGERQSPIDIKPVDIKPLNVNERFEWRYVPENSVEILNPGYTWKVHVHGEGSALTGGPLDGKYILEQFHCHWGDTDDEGSEHTINGKKFSGELHLVHWNSTKYKSFEEAAHHSDGICVLGVFLKSGRKHKEMDKIVSLLDCIEYKGQTAKIPFSINPASFLPCCSGYYTYQGSLTTPPCSECVIWIVFKEPIEISPDQLAAFRNLKCYYPEHEQPCDEFNGYVKCNFRPTVPLGEREVKEWRQ